MTTTTPIGGVIAASITPIRSNCKPDYGAIPAYLDFLAQRGCHGALVLGTTGEGPSFSFQERKQIYRSALEIKQKYPDFLLLAGTGTPSLDETIRLTKFVFEIGLDGVVVLPPYYFRNASQAGLLVWFNNLMDKAVPQEGRLFAYHIPQLTGIRFPIEFLARLHDLHPTKFAGLKDSSAEEEYAKELGKRFGKDLTVFTGQDRLFGFALRNQAAGCITAGANLFSPWLRQVYDAHIHGIILTDLEDKIKKARSIMDQYSPASALIKAVLPSLFKLPLWTVRPPILPLEKSQVQSAIQQLSYECGITET
ncbi:MAG: dihydrodipicolinate synthase family protein [Anaerolineales bacterium]